MPKSSAHNDWLPPQAVEALRALGANLALARARRREPLRDWAKRIGVSVRTLQRLEAGDPGGHGRVRGSAVADGPSRRVARSGRPRAGPRCTGAGRAPKRRSGWHGVTGLVSECLPSHRHAVPVVGGRPRSAALAVAARSATLTDRLQTAALTRQHRSRKCGFATWLDPHGGRSASAGLGALSSAAAPGRASHEPPKPWRD